MNNDTPLLNTPSVLTRRDFIQKGSLALAGLGMLGISQSALADGETAKTPSNEESLKLPFIQPLMNEDGSYRTPPLAYPYEALEPIIDRETMHLHHDIHFEGYTKGLNEALEALKIARSKSDYSFLSYWENQLAFHGAGYMLHCLFFSQMIAPGKSQPSDKIKSILNRHFGSFESFQAQFNAAATQVQGSGWALLAYEPVGKKLIILQAEKHQNLTQWSCLPLLALDVWEHAYYLKYQNRRAEYVKAWWSVVDYGTLEGKLAALMA